MISFCPDWLAGNQGLCSLASTLPTTCYCLSFSHYFPGRWGICSVSLVKKKAIPRQSLISVPHTLSCCQTEKRNLFFFFLFLSVLSDVAQFEQYQVSGGHQKRKIEEGRKACPYFSRDPQVSKMMREARDSSWPCCGQKRREKAPCYSPRHPVCLFLAPIFFWHL